MTVTLPENNSKRRDKLVIMTEIIDIAKNGTSKTHIMFAANLSFSQLNQYLELLCQSNLLEKSKNNADGREIYRATEKGLEFMEKQCQVIKLVNSNFLKNQVKTFLPLKYTLQRSDGFIKF